MTTLGIDTKTGQEVKIYGEDIILGGYLVGVRRMGKSTLLENLCVQAIEQHRGIVVIDPHGDSLYNILNRVPPDRMDDVILLDPKDYLHPFGLNIYHCEDKDNPVAVEFTINRVMSLFAKIFPSEDAQPLVEDVIRNTAYTIIANGMTMTEVDPLLTDAAFRRRLVANETNPAVQLFWKSYESLSRDEKEKWGGTVARRVRGFTTSGIIRYLVGQAENTLPITDILNTKKILLVRLYSDMKQLTSLIGSILVGQMLQSALSRSGVHKEDRPEVHLFCDEYSRFATDDFAEIISECGKYNLIPFIAHQSRGQISEENQDSAIQLGNLFCFKLIGRDSDKLANEFNLTPPEEKKVIPSDPLYHLTDHPSNVVRTFEREYVRRLLEAKAMITRTEEEERAQTNAQGTTIGMGLYKPYKIDVDVYPEHEFHQYAERVKFDPDRLRYEVLPLLDSILYRSMTEKDYNTTDDIFEFMRLTRRWYGFEAVVPNDGFDRKNLPPTLTDTTEWAMSADRDDLKLERLRFSHLLIGLVTTAEDLKKDPISVTPSTGGKPQRTYSDMAGQISNELTRLPPHTARIKTPKGEYVIKTIAPKTDRRDLERKRIQVVEHTRRTYCTPRAEVEEHIRVRQTLDTPPTQRTQRI